MNLKSHSLILLLLSFTLLFSFSYSLTVCLPPCSTCLSSSNPTACTSCLSPFGLNSGYCVLNNCPILYCQTCDSTQGYCIACQNNFMLINKTCVCQGNYQPSHPGSPESICVCPGPSSNSTNVSCLSCPIPGCTVCATSTQCLTCGPGFSSNGQGGCVQCNITNCQTCQTNNFCAICLNNLTVTYTGTCASCNRSSPGCVECNINNQCVCASGYQLYVTSNGSYCLPCNIPYCLTCSSSNINTCITCTYSYTLSSDFTTCTLNSNNKSPNCTLPCLTCSSSGFCYTCAPPFYPFANSQGKCLITNIPFCLTYNTSNITQCSVCQNNYYKNSITQQCDYKGNMYCSMRNSSNYSICVSCMPTYTVVYGLCQPCNAGPACQLCTTNLTTCTACLNGFFLQYALCQPCQPYCVTCTNSYSCSEYIFADAYNTPNVPYLSVTDMNIVTIALCPSSCFTCNSLNLFCFKKSCNPGFYYAGQGVCAPCLPSSNCQTCGMQNPSVCITCPNNFMLALDNMTCVACLWPCATCLNKANLAVCLSCNTGYTLINNTCVFNNCTDPNCMVCSSSNTCFQCLPGYLPSNSNSTCIPGVPSCNFTSSLNPSICISCYPGNSLSYTTNHCFNCPDNCFYCTAANTCQNCMAGYYPTGNPSIICAPNCIYPCLACLFTNPNTCTSCIAGYTFSNGTCLPRTNCSNTATCQYCPLGFGFMAPQTCLPCNVSNCATCNSNSPNCTGCMPGYYLSFSQCLICSPGCQSCLNGSSCITCSIGYTTLTFPQVNGTQNTNICVACTSPCSSCWGHPSACLSCMPGYIRIGTQCITNTFFSVSASFNTSLQTFISSYPVFLNQVLSSVGLTYNSFFVTGIIQNPLTFTFQLSTPCTNSTCIANANANLSSILNGTTAGMSIVSSQVYSSTVSSLNTTASNNCTSPCKTCTVPGGSICLSCNYGFTVLANNTCLNSYCPILYCTYCVGNDWSGYSCKQCMPTFTLIGSQCLCQNNYQVNIFNSPNSTCVCTNNCTTCTIANCLTCFNSTFCTQCATNYTTRPNGGCTSCNIPNCQTCIMDGVCSACQTNYTLGSNGCYNCQNNVTNCASCNASGTCLYCNSGYQLVTINSEQTCIICSLQYCFECSSNNFCKNCLPTYTLNSNGTCSLNTSKCPLPCLSCNSTGVCQLCQFPYSTIPANGSCYLCFVPFCSTCNSLNTSICIICADGYVLNPNNSSNCIPTLYCTNISTSGVCTACLSLYTLNANNGTCVPCQTGQACMNCSIQNVTVCTACQPGFFLSNNTCNQCPPLCSVCTNSTCLIYSPSVFIINQQVVLATCLPTCICSTSNPYFCTSCQAGYYLVNGTCLPCDPNSNCYSCNVTNSSQCTRCMAEGVLQSGTNVCVYCDPLCMQCIGQNNCTSCIGGSGYAPINGVCSPIRSACSSFCLVCENTYCFQCKPGYTPGYNGSCLPAVAGCMTHYPPNPSICQACEPGMVLNPYNNICIQCPLNCYQCTVSQVCLTCFNGFYLTGLSSVVCAPNCLYPCLSCSLTNASFCTSCQVGYTFNPSFSNQCQPSTNCSSFNCTICPSGYVLNSSQCIACNPSCLTCSTSSPKNCTVCPYAQYVSNGQCLSCFSGCVNCTSSKYCLNCGPNYVQFNFLPGYDFALPVATCIPCQFPCQSCGIMSTYCLTCVTGYTLVGFQCLNNNNYLFNVTFSSNLTVFLSNYGTLVNLIGNSVAPENNLNLAFLFPTGLSSQGNSTFYSVVISSQCLPQSLCSQHQYQVLNSSLTSNFIAGMSVSNSLLISNFNTSSSSNSTVVCSSPCTSCNSITGACTGCINNFVIVNGQCLNQSCTVPNCQMCSSSSSTTCLQCVSNKRFILSNGSCICQSGFFVLNGACVCNPSTSTLTSQSASVSTIDTCLLCQIQNCLSCTTATSCNSCAAPYTLNQKGICVICSIQNCVSCSSNNYCGQCVSPLIVSAFGDRCISNCTIPNCLACTQASSCAACRPGFSFNIDNSACVTCSIPNCLVCSNNNLCALCQISYSLSANFTICQPSLCAFPCTACLPNSTTCSACISPPYNSLPTSDGTCYTCDAANCLSCSFNNTSVCLSCSSQFTLVNGSCLSTCNQAQCLTCNPLNTSMCTACASGYALSLNGSCTSCPYGCLTCGSSEVLSCLSCIKGFYLTNSTCIACPSYCSSCTSLNSCASLAQSKGRVLANINGNPVLALCDQGCVSCVTTNPSICLTCQSGFFLSNSICQPCNRKSNCQTCNNTNPVQCLTCFANAFLGSNGTCNVCQQPCLSCSQSNSSACLSCPYGYLLQNSSCLQNSCPLYCLACNTNTICIKCINGYIPVNGTCTPCLMGCSQCSISSPGLCLSCSSGTYLDPTTNTCLGCSLNCLTCLPNGCTTCMTGFYLSTDLTCSPNCLPPCATCSSTDPTNCLSCTLGYNFDTTALQNCAPSINCSSTFTCVGCPMGYVLSNLQCLSCNSGCVRCLSNAPQNCTSCLNGQYLSDSATCLTCPTGCDSCISSVLCVECASGYTSITTVSSGSPVQCAACASPCSTCQSSPSLCLTCVNGYTLMNSICVSNFNFGFNVTLNVDPATFYQNYINFLQVLSAIVSSQYGSVSLNAIKQSSTIVQGTMSTTSSPQTPTSQSQYQDLLNTLNTGGTVAGMPVIAASVTTNGGSPTPTTSEGSSTAGWVIAVAVVVPIVVISIIAVFVICYCRRKKEKQASIQMQIQRSDKQSVELQSRRPIF